MADSSFCDIVVSLSAVIVSVENNRPRILMLPPGEEKEYASLPYGIYSPESHRTLELGLKAWVKSLTGLDLGYVEQLYTFGNLFRSHTHEEKGGRLLTISYLALTHSSRISEDYNANWQNWYDFFPWEDHRKERAAAADQLLEELYDWADEAPDRVRRLERLERIQFAFGGGKWDPDRLLFRYELLYEAALIAEAMRDWNAWPKEERVRLPINRENPGRISCKVESGIPLMYDNRRILASAIGRLRGKLRYRPLVFELLPEKFTLLQIQNVMEAIDGVSLHKQNFRRLLLAGGLIKETGEMDRTSPGRPASLFRFRKSTHMERQQVQMGHGNN